jgi:hypothetical protein
VVIGRKGTDLFLVPISSQLANTDFALADWRGAGLNVLCGIKAQIVTVEEKLAVKTVGTLTSKDQKALDDRLRHWLQL